MRVLHVIDQLSAGGAERVCCDLVNISQERGVSVGLLVLLNEASLDFTINSAVEVYYLRRGSKLDITKYLRAARLCDRYDIIHVHMRHVYLYMALVKMLTKSTCRFVLHDHYGDIHTNKKVPYLFRSFFKPSYFIGVSDELTNWAILNAKINVHRVFLLRNIVRLSRERNRLFNAGDVVVVSNIRRTKNIELAIEVAVELNLKLDIIGQLVDDSYYEELKSIILEKHAGGRIRFVHDCHDVQPFLHHYKLALHPSSSETGPLVLIEYLAQGITFVAHKTGDVAESLYPLFPQLFLEVFDINSWKDRVLALINHPVDKALLEKGFHDHFREDEYFRKCLDIYNKIRLC